MSPRGAARKRTAAKKSRRRQTSMSRAGRPRISRAEAMTRIAQFIAISENRTIQMSALCRASGVSERTLRAIFLEVFGMSPMRYLRARKLHAIRAELSVADPSSVTVAAIARRVGVKDAGRMARDYYTIFGEYPRATLERRLTARASSA